MSAENRKAWDIAYKNGQYCRSLKQYISNPYSAIKGSMLQFCAWSAGYHGY